MASVYKLSYTAKEIDDKLGEIDNVVKITAQTLTDEQKAQARANIGAAAVGEAGDGGGAAQIDWADITNKPVITEGGDTLTWDGNTEGVTDDMVVANVLVWVSDAVVINANDIPEEGIVVDCDTFGGVQSIPREHITITEDGCFISEPLMIVPYDNYDATELIGEPLVIPKKGNYLMGGVGPISVTIPGYTGFGTEKIAPSHLYQPDWNQINETAPDFIKNRTHWAKEPVTTTEVIFPEGTYTFSEGSYQIEYLLFIENNEECVVTWDGVEYTVIANKVTVEGMDFIVFGNPVILELGENPEDNGMPFAGAYFLD